MYHIQFIKKTCLSFLVASLISCGALAQDTAASGAATASNYNQFEIILVSILGLLAFVIWLLGRVLLVLGKQVIEKNKVTKTLPVLLLAAFLTMSLNSSAQDVQTITPNAIFNYGGLSPFTFYLLLSVLITEGIIISFLTFLIKRFSAELLPEKKAVVAKENKFNLWWTKLNKKLTRAVPVEKEADVMLDHDYDGIRELDNALPPWWKYGFYITICVAIIYFLNFEVLGYGKNPTQEYNDEMAKASIEHEMYEANNKDKIDENNVTMANTAGLTAAKEIFTTKCFACHGKLGEGGAGPNLTDNYWLHGGTLNEIYHTIKNGYPDKGMQSWATVYSPKEISYLASFVKTLHGTNPPNAKAPQGDLFVDSSHTNQPAHTTSGLSKEKRITGIDSISTSFK